MKVERHEVGPRMSQIVIHGDTVYLAGIVAQNSGGKSVTEQTKEILATIDGYLAKAGTDKSKLLTANIWLANMDTFAEMNAVWDAWVSPGNTPARATVQVAGGVPAMCDGITQGTAGMELSLFSRDNIAMGTAIALSHDVFDAALLLGVCDKIVPGLVIGALSFGHLPTILVPAGPMPPGLPNAEIYALCTRTDSRLQELGRKFGATKLYTDYEEMLADPEVEAVILAFPAQHRTALALQALDIFGYQPPPEGVNIFQQSQPALNAIRWMVGPAGALLVVAAIIVAWFYPLSREKYAEIRRELNARQENGQDKAVSAPVEKQI